MKAWIYLTLGKIYGEAVWFNDPVREMKNLDEIVEGCLDLLTKGFDGKMARIQCHGKNGLILIRKQRKYISLLGLYDTRILCIIWRVMFVAW